MSTINSDEQKLEACRKIVRRQEVLLEKNAEELLKQFSTEEEARTALLTQGLEKGLYEEMKEVEKLFHTGLMLHPELQEKIRKYIEISFFCGRVWAERWALQEVEK